MENPVTDLKRADQDLMAPVEEEADFCSPHETFKDRWIIMQKLSAGCFGQIYVVKDSELNTLQAFKVESVAREDRVTLPLELQVLKKFQGNSVHAPGLYGAGTERNVNFIAMQLLGRNLAMYRHLCPHEPKRFSFNTAMRLFKQCLEAIRDLHSINYIHRDIKPANFAMGRQPFSNKNVVYILDFGMSRCFTDSKGNLRPARTVAGFRGTDLGRRDDLISLFYMVTEFLLGGLPWKNAPNAQDVIDSKERHLLPRLIVGLPKLESFGHNLLSLEFADRPQYALLIDCTNQIIQENKIYSTDLWDWENDYKYPALDLNESNTTETTANGSVSNTEQ